MLTDSRSFLFFPRREYFRRILCRTVGRRVESGELPGDETYAVNLVRNISWYNAKNYFGIEIPAWAAKAREPRAAGLHNKVAGHKKRADREVSRSALFIGKGPGSSSYFSVSVMPATNCFCITMTTSTGGIKARSVVAMTICHSMCWSAADIIRLMPMSRV